MTRTTKARKTGVGSRFPENAARISHHWKTTPDTGFLLRAFVSSWLCVVAGCSAGSARRDLLPAPLPDVSRVDPGVQAQVRGRYETLSRALAENADAAELATAF